MAEKVVMHLMPPFKNKCHHKSDDGHPKFLKVAFNFNHLGVINEKVLIYGNTKYIEILQQSSLIKDGKLWGGIIHWECHDIL